MAAMALRAVVRLRRPYRSGPILTQSGVPRSDPSPWAGTGAVGRDRAEVSRAQPVTSPMASDATSRVWSSSARPWAMDGKATS